MSKFCQNCGVASNDTDKFCHKCGTKLYDAQDSEAMQEQAQNQAMQMQVQGPLYVMVEEELYVPDKGIRQMFFRWDNRLNRKRYFMRVMMLQLLMVPLSLLVMVVPHQMAMAISFIPMLFLIPIGMLSIRRCHDLGRSGWFLVKTAIPILGMMFCLHYLFSDHDEYSSPFLNSTFFVLLLGLPFVGLLVWIYLMFASGMRGANEYGADPLGAQEESGMEEKGVLGFLSRMEAPGEMRGILGLLAAVVLVTVIPGMAASVFSDRKSSAAVAVQNKPQEKQGSSQMEAARPAANTSNAPAAPAPPPSAPVPAAPVPPAPPNSSVKAQQGNTPVNTGKADAAKENRGANAAQREAIATLYRFHENITQKSLRQAYDCMSPAMQKRVSYDGWAPGFKTTVSSTVSDVKVATETGDRMVLTYYLQSVDNPGGTKNFTGTAIMVKSGGGWKIEEITNKLK